MKAVFCLLIGVLVIAGCAGSAASPAVTPPVIETVEDPLPTSLPAVTEQALPTEPPTTLSPTEIPATLPPTEPAADLEPAGAVTYQIVPGESQVTYEVGEVFIDQNNRFNVAQGITPQVTGEIQVDFENPQASSIGPIEVDISQFTSDSGRRDNALRERFLESARFPIATFTPTSITGLPDTYQEGEPVSFQVSGDLTIREVTLPVTFDVTASARQDSLEGSATTTLLMSDYGFGPISIAGILNTEDEVKLDFQFVARPAE